jgi:hypothetical protein
MIARPSCALLLPGLTHAWPCSPGKRLFRYKSGGDGGIGGGGGSGACSPHHGPAGAGAEGCGLQLGGSSMAASPFATSPVGGRHNDPDAYGAGGFYFGASSPSRAPQRRIARAPFKVSHRHHWVNMPRASGKCLLWALLSGQDWLKQGKHPCAAELQESITGHGESIDFCKAVVAIAAVLACSHQQDAVLQPFPDLRPPFP